MAHLVPLNSGVELVLRFRLNNERRPLPPATLGVL